MYQVTASAFGPYAFGEPIDSAAFLTTGFRPGKTGQLDLELPLTPPRVIAPANKTGVMADYQVRIVPILAVDKPQAVGAPSNIFVVKTYAAGAAYTGPKIKTWTVDPTVQVVNFTWVPYKYTAHWPPGCKAIPIGGSSQKSEIEVVGEFVGDAWTVISKVYEDAKKFVVKTVVAAVAIIPPGIEIPPALAAKALDLALVAAGVPPTIPESQQRHVRRRRLPRAADGRADPGAARGRQGARRRRSRRGDR